MADILTPVHILIAAAVVAGVWYAIARARRRDLQREREENAYLRGRLDSERRPKQ